jgi:hypothetical protein
MKKINCNYLKSCGLFLLLFVLTGMVQAQNKMGDNPTVVQSGSLLELESLTKGLRLPRIALNDISLWTLDGTAVSGMLIYNESGTVAKGIYYWNTTLAQWVRVTNATELSALTLGAPSATSYANGGYISGNALYLAYADGTNPGLLSTASQSIAGAKTFTSAITAPTATNTINSLIINAGDLSGITGYTQASGNFAMTGSGTFGTGTGALSLNGNTKLASGKSLSLTGSTSGTVGFVAPATVTSYSLTWPSAVASAAGQVLSSTTGGVLSWASPTAYTASNGLTMTSNNVALGGSLTAATTIAQAGYKLSFSNTLTTGSAFDITGTGAYTGTGMVTIANNAATTGTLATISSSSLTTGTGLNISSSNSALNSTNGLLYVANASTSTSGITARIQSNSTAGSGLTVLGSGNVGIGTATPTSKLEVKGAATNTTAYSAGSSTTIDFTQSNLAYTTASAGSFTLTGLKDGGTYTLAVRGTTTGTASFTQSGMTFKSTNNAATTSGYQTVYTFIVMGTTVYYWMNSGF